MQIQVKFPLSRRPACVIANRNDVMRRCPLFLASLLAVLHASTSSTTTLSDRTHFLTAEQAEAQCSRYSALYPNIDADLNRWQRDGIPLRLMQNMILNHTMRKKGQRGFAAGFWRGKAYLIDEPDMSEAGHHQVSTEDTGYQFKISQCGTRGGGG